jgi:N-acetyl-gamma-glutamylphosphate reductase
MIEILITGQAGFTGIHLYSNVCLHPDVILK